MFKNIKLAALGLVAASAMLPVAPINAALSKTARETITEIQTDTAGEQLVAGRYRRNRRRVRVYRRRPRRRRRLLPPQEIASVALKGGPRQRRRRRKESRRLHGGGSRASLFAPTRRRGEWIRSLGACNESLDSQPRGGTKAEAEVSGEFLCRR